MTRTSRLMAAGAAAAALGLGGWAAAAALQPARPSTIAGAERPMLQVRYEIVREPAYVPPPPSEATRLEVLTAQAPTTVEEGVLSAQAGAALRALQAQDAARTAEAVAAVRAEDVRIDRETASAFEDERAAPAGDDAGAPTHG